LGAENTEHSTEKKRTEKNRKEKKRSLNTNED
jgi:hypothetical protein